MVIMYNVNVICYISGMSRASGFCPFIGGKTEDPLPPISYILLLMVCDSKTAALQRGWALGQSPKVIVFIMPYHLPICIQISFWDNCSISKLLKKSNFYKEGGIQCVVVLKEIFGLVFSGSPFVVGVILLHIFFKFIHSS